jgi:hypothetical protein
MTAAPADLDTAREPKLNREAAIEVHQSCRDPPPTVRRVTTEARDAYIDSSI